MALVMNTTLYLYIFGNESSVYLVNDELILQVEVLVKCVYGCEQSVLLFLSVFSHMNCMTYGK